jgi:hypothetical protein
MPRSARTSKELRFLNVDDLTLMRPVVLYAVAGRQRSAAASGLIRLLRAANWAKLLDLPESIKLSSGALQAASRATPSATRPN